MSGSDEQLVWYVSYGSNLHAARFACYLTGGVPPGGARRYPGARDRRPPRDDAGLQLPGSVFFARHSDVWGGGVAFYDPDTPGPAAARGYLLTAAQFADVVAQENGRRPGADLNLSGVLATGSAGLASGWYDRLLDVGRRDGHPMLTFTTSAPRAELPPGAPSSAYLATLVRGLGEAHRWDPARAAAYLAALPGVAGVWTPADVAALGTG